jgi:hypothetical protein
MKVAAGVTGHVWTVADIVSVIEVAEPIPAKRSPYKKKLVAKWSLISTIQLTGAIERTNSARLPKISKTLQQKQ